MCLAHPNTATSTGVAAAVGSGAAFEDGESGGGQAQQETAAHFTNDTLLPAVSKDGHVVCVVRYGSSGAAAAAAAVDGEEERRGAELRHRVRVLFFLFLLCLSFVFYCICRPHTSRRTFSQTLLGLDG